MSAPLVVVTRDESADATLSSLLAASGAAPWSLPCTRTAAVEDPAELDAALSELASFRWLVLTSARAVDALLARPGWTGTWTRAPRPRVAAVGAATAERLRAAGLRVDCSGGGAGAVALVAELERSHAGLAGARVLWPRSERARPALRQGLAAAGAEVVDPVAYRTLAAAPDQLRDFVERLARQAIDAVAFLSPSAAQGLALSLPGRDLSALRDRTLVASLGPTTSAALRELGAPPDLQAPLPEAGALARSLMRRLLAREGVPR